jgi:molybdate transport system regulatory protein
VRVAFKVWLDSDGKAFGEGPYRLLRGVDRTGSLRQAAMEMRMSYRKAWLTVSRCEERLGFPLLERKVGGSSGGGSRLTEEAMDFLMRYESFSAEAAQALREIYDRHFESGSSAELREPA